jgi:hypothetical protein
MQLPRPDFAVDSENEDLELWTFRLPINVPVKSLNDVEIDLNTNTGEFQVGDQAYKFVLGDAVENDSFRALVPAKKDDKSNDSSSDDDDDDSDNDDGDDNDIDKASNKQEFLQPSALPFARHWNAVTAVPVLSETQLAPREGPPPVDVMRHAYSHVPQRTGLKRRWMPMGVNFDKSAMPADVKIATRPTKKTVKKEKDITPPPTKRIKVVKDEVKEEQEEAVEAPMSSSDKKSIKAEKKSAKKAKKEAKKIKKEKRKSK